MLYAQEVLGLSERGYGLLLSVIALLRILFSLDRLRGEGLAITGIVVSVVIGLIVLCSALAGAAVERTVIQRMMVRRRPPPLGANGATTPYTREQDARRRSDMIERMAKELTLSNAQRAGIDSVMWHTDSLLHGIRVEMQPRLSKVLADSRAEINKRLDADQRVKFDKMTAERRLRRP